MQGITVSVANPFDAASPVEMTVLESWSDSCHSYVGKSSDGVRVVKRFAPIPHDEAVRSTLDYLAWKWLQRKRRNLNSAWKNNLRVYEVWTAMTNEIHGLLAK